MKHIICIDTSEASDQFISCRLSKTVLYLISCNRALQLHRGHFNRANAAVSQVILDLYPHKSHNPQSTNPQPQFAYRNRSQSTDRPGEAAHTRDRETGHLPFGSRAFPTQNKFRPPPNAEDSSLSTTFAKPGASLGYNFPRRFCRSQD
jgi:hypothetical protein